MNKNFNYYFLAGKTILFSAFFTASLLSCRTAELAVDKSLKNDTETYEVKGRQGSQIGQVISFGAYKTTKVSRGWTFSYSIPFIVQFQGAKEKLSFSQFGPNSTSAEVALVSRFRENDIEPVKDYFSLSVKYQNYFAGAIRLSNNTDPWDFIVHNVDGASRTLKQNATMGFVRNRHMRIDITGIRELEGSSSFITQNDVYGYEFRIDGKVVGAVSTINNGKVWFRKELSDDLRLVLASVSSGLMLRNNVEENAVSLN